MHVIRLVLPTRSCIDVDENPDIINACLLVWFLVCRLQNSASWGTGTMRAKCHRPKNSSAFSSFPFTSRTARPSSRTVPGNSVNAENSSRKPACRGHRERHERAVLQRSPKPRREWTTAAICIAVAAFCGTFAVSSAQHGTAESLKPTVEDVTSSLRQVSEDEFG